MICRLTWIMDVLLAVVVGAMVSGCANSIAHSENADKPLGLITSGQMTAVEQNNPLQHIWINVDIISVDGKKAYRSDADKSTAVEIEEGKRNVRIKCTARFNDGRREIDRTEEITIEVRGGWRYELAPLNQYCAQIYVFSKRREVNEDYIGESVNPILETRIVSVNNFFHTRSTTMKQLWMP